MYASALTTAAESSLLPHDESSEQALLGSIMMADGLILDDLEWVKSSDFYLLKHQWIYEAMISLRSRRENVDNVTVQEELTRRNQLNDCGGSSYLTILITCVPYHLNYPTYAAAVKSLSRQREVMTMASRLAEAGLRGDIDTVRKIVEKVTALAQEHPMEANRLRPFLVHEKDLDKLPPMTWLVPSEIPANGFVLIYGPSGVGKSFFALEFALRLGQAYPVVYIAAEGESGYPVRVKAWRKHNHMQPGQVQFFLNMISLLDDSERSEFADLLKPIKPRVIFVDTMAHVMLPGDENNTRDMGSFIKACKSLQKMFNCAVVMVHHTGKEGDRERGNSALRAACDVMIRLQDDDGLIAVECTKSKDTKPFPTRFVRLLPVALDDGTSSPIVISAEKVKQLPSDPLSENQKMVLRVFTLKTFPDGCTIADISEVTNKQRGVVQRWISRLIDLGFVVHGGRGEPYQITVDGLDKLNEKEGESSESRLTHDSGMTHPAPNARLQQSDAEKSKLTHLTHPDSPSKTTPKIEKDGESCESSSTERTTAPIPLFNKSESRGESSGESSPESMSQGVSHPRIEKLPEIEAAQSRQRTLPFPGKRTEAPRPTEVCPKCGELQWYQDFRGQWKCRSCRNKKQLEDTQSGD